MLSDVCNKDIYIILANKVLFQNCEQWFSLERLGNLITSFVNFLSTHSLRRPPAWCGTVVVKLCHRQHSCSKEGLLGVAGWKQLGGLPRVSLPASVRAAPHLPALYVREPFCLVYKGFFCFKIRNLKSSGIMMFASFHKLLFHSVVCFWNVNTYR